MKSVFLSLAAIMALGLPAHADGDVAKGEKAFSTKCKACHSLVDADGNKVVKGGIVGPNLWGVVGRAPGSNAEFATKYSTYLAGLAGSGMVWDATELMAWIADPNAWLKDKTGDAGAKSKMVFKLADAEDIVAYLATFSPPAE
jgi:cytochrome c